uniref:Peptidase A2 domain-containing protein n=1 Tax=Stomoxys calcitrans TaxID=35570 RepID=A0A1I8Q3Y0_STOCA
MFDGSTAFDVFKFQFETIAVKNSWNDYDKAIELLLALKGSAAEVLQSIPVSPRNNYEEVIASLQRKYEGEQKQDRNRMELRGRVQKLNETLQDFATEVERLVLLTNPGENHPLLDRIVLQENTNIIAAGYINGDRRILTLDTGASKSLNGEDLVKGRISLLNGVRLRTATGESETVKGKVVLKLIIAGISVKYEFIVADNVDEVIIGADFIVLNWI